MRFDQRTDKGSHGGFGFGGHRIILLDIAVPFLMEISLCFQLLRNRFPCFPVGGTGTEV